MNDGKIVEMLDTLLKQGEEFKGNFKEINARFDSVDEKLEDLKASAGAVDDLLTAHPIQRIERLEKHSGLPKFALASEDE